MRRDKETPSDRLGRFAKLRAQGLTMKVIAERLGISQQRVSDLMKMYEAAKARGEEA